MPNEDTIKLLKECDAGTKTAISSIKEVLDNVKSKDLLLLLTKSTEEHELIIKDIKEYLDEIEGDGKDPSPMAKMMSWAKINMKMMMHEDDKTIASLIIDGCNMGIKQLTGYLNDYTEADEKAKHLAKRLINEEENLSDSLKKYL